MHAVLTQIGACAIDKLDMAKPLDLKIWDWNRMVDAFHGESDRGAAVLAGGFVENFLGVYLKSFVVDEKVGRDVFDAMGPLSSFSQRTAMARAFGYITRRQYDDLTLVRQIRNHFAHHPLESTFATPKVATMCVKLGEYQVAQAESAAQLEAQINRTAYLFSCITFCGQAHLRMEKRASINSAAEPKSSSTASNRK